MQTIRRVDVDVHGIDSKFVWLKDSGMEADEWDLGSFVQGR